MQNESNKNPLQDKEDIRQYIERQAQIDRDKIREDLRKDMESHKRFLTTRLTIVGTIVIAILGIFGFSIRGIHHEVRRTIEGEKKRIVEFMDATKDTLQKTVEESRLLVFERLDQEFKTERIRTLVDEKAQEYVEKEAKSHISKIVEERIEPLVSEIEQLVTFYELEALEAAARFGSRKAYEELLKLSKTKTAYKDMTSTRVGIVKKEYEIYETPPIAFMELTVIRKGKEIPFKNFSAKEMFNYFENPTVSEQEKHTIMAYIIEKPKHGVFTEALRILKSSNSLSACAATCGILKRILGEKAAFLDFDGWVKVCEEELRKMK